MANLDLSIPTTSVASAPGKPHTVYHVTVRLPLRTLTLKKRYSEFVELHARLTELCGGTPPPRPLPPKHYFFTSTLNNPALTEERRAALEAYLRAIIADPDPRWRDSPAWRTFLSLPSSWTTSTAGGTAGGGALGGKGGGGGQNMPTGPITDAALWLDTHREAKALLHDARMHLARREQAGAATTEQHESSAAAKRSLVKAGALLSALDAGLRELARGGGGGGGGGARRNEKAPEILEGELRRRRDLVATARKDKAGLESLANSLAARRTGTSPAISGMGETPSADKAQLFAGSASQAQAGRGRGGGRVLGAPQETERTRELDNEGVLQLQKQIFREQDQGLENLLKIVRRQKEMGIAIGEEVETQIEIMRQLEDDVDRVNAKTIVARKRADKVS